MNQLNVDLPKLKRQQSFARKASILCGAVIISSFSTSCLATYNCGGSVSYLGIDAGGDVAVAVSQPTPIHKICNVLTQGSYLMSVPSCKVAYSAFLTARLSGKVIWIYYNDNGMACGTLPSWGQVPGVYFVEGPN